MHPNDTQTTPTPGETRYAYFLALCRAVGELVDDVDVRESATVYVPGWFEAGGPWALTRTTGPHQWRVQREDHRAADGRGKPARLVLAFHDDVVGVAARLATFDEANPFVIDQFTWYLTPKAAHYA